MHSLDTRPSGIAVTGEPSEEARSNATEENRLLRALPADEYERLLPHLEPAELTAGQVLWQPDARIHSVYFPRTAVMSLLTPLEDEPPVEAATVGREGIVGTSVALGVRRTGVRVIAQISGLAARMEADRLADWLRTPDNSLL